MTENVVCIIAHPDDETLFAGGTLAMLADRGMKVHIVAATRGEGGEMGDPPLASRQTLGAVRERELRCAARALGAVEVRFLGYIDPLTGPDGQLFPYAEDEEEVARRVAEVLVDIQPFLLLTHGSDGEYGHPAHVLTHRAVLRAHARVRKRGVAPYLYTFSAALPGAAEFVLNLGDTADVVIDVEPWMAAKVRAANCHRTQHALFFRYYPDVDDLADLLPTVEGLHRVWPPDGPDPEIFAPYGVRRRTEEAEP